MENMILEARHISKYFGSLTANDDVSLSVRRGTVHAIIGENGAGKSTLMNVISGIYKPNRGEIYVEGKQVVSEIQTMRRNAESVWCIRSLCCFLN